MRRKRDAGGDGQQVEPDDTAGYDASVWFEHSNAYAFFEEDGGEVTTDHHAARPGNWADLDDEDEVDPWETRDGGAGGGDWAAAEFDDHGGTTHEHAAREPEAFEAQGPAAAEAAPARPKAPVEDTARGGAGPAHEARTAAGPPPAKFVFLAAATRYALDLMPPDEFAGQPPETPPVADDDVDGDEEADDDHDAAAAYFEDARGDDAEVPAHAPVAPATHHGGRGRKGRRIHAQRRPGRPATKRRAAIAALVLTGGIAGTAVALSGSGGGERIAARTPTTDGFRDDLLTTPSTFYALADLPDPGVADTTTPVTAPVTAPVTVASTTTPTTRATTPTAATTVPPATTTTVVPMTTMPPFTTTTLATTTTTRATTTTTAITTTTTAPATTTTQPTTTTTTTEAP